MSQRPENVPIRRFTPVKPSVPAGAMIRQDQREEAINAAVVAYDRRDQYAAEIHALWKQAQGTFLRIGHYLELAKERLPHGEFEEMIARDLPFDRRTAFMIRAASRAVRTGRLPSDRLPPNYSVIYQLSTMDDEKLREAEAAGLIRPTLRRAEVIAFKRRLEAGAAGVANDRRRRELIEARDKLRRQQREIAEQLAKIEAEIGAEDESEENAGASGVIIDGDAEDLGAARR